MKLTNKPFFLVEFHAGETQNIVLEKPDGGKVFANGLKISRVVDKDCKELATYDSTKEFGIDLTCLKIEGGCHIVSVNSIDGKTLCWIGMDLINSNPDGTEFIIGAKWKCDEEECKLLNETFPQYFDHCRLDRSEFVKANEEFVKQPEGHLELPTE